MSASINAPVAALRPEEDPAELYEHAPCAYLSCLPDGTIIKFNMAFAEWAGYERDEILGKRRFQDLLPVAGRVFHDTHFQPLLLMQGFARELAFELLGKDGRRIPVLLNAVLKREENGTPQVIRIVLIDAQNRRAYEEELRRAKQKAEVAENALKRLTAELEVRVADRTQERDRIWRMSQDVLGVASPDGRFVSVNPAFGRILGWTDSDLADLPAEGLAGAAYLRMPDAAAAALTDGQPARFEMPALHKDGSERCIAWTVVPKGDRLYLAGRDITEEKRQAELLRKTEAALLQSKKMEAIGKLTGGVAHDFNNILQVIAGNLELLKMEFAGHSSAQPRLQATIAAVGRAASLASQLLSFARRQPLRPVSTDLGRILRDMDGFLRRALGESIDIETIVSGGLWTALVDRSQLENVILNLAINARDAMNGAGKLTIELGNAMLDDDYVRMHGEVTAGQYVMLAVSDTGCGIAPELVERVFEPFFTTKRDGEGTGLGLSMAYGFVKQSGGHIKIYSEPGHGTTFRIYLPRAYQAEAVLADSKHGPVVGGTETVLVVEDDAAVRATVVEMLTSLGYRVLTARDGQNALTALASGTEIDLLFTDVVMPGPVRSPDLARQAKQMQPRIEVLFTSGYTQNAIVHGGRLDPGVELISKPYRREDLARKIRQVLANRTQATSVKSV